jgi:uncharacterized protein (TIGR03084 family)
MREILEDLKAEQEALDALVSGLSHAQWELPTPAEGWSVRDCISHLAHIDGVAVQVMRGDQTPFDVARKVLMGFNDLGLERGRAMDPAGVLSWWRDARRVELEELARRDPKERLPWFAMPMGARAFATARLMETWAHGLDCFDAVGVAPEDTDRLRHVALLAFLARPWAYQINGIPLPPEVPRLELTLPSGTRWTQGPEDSTQRICGAAGDFCRVAVRRRHWTDTALEVAGDEARRFLEIAQAYAGYGGPGRRPGGKGRP